MHYLYLIVREDAETYVGVTKHIDRRMKEHYKGQGNKHLKGQTFNLGILAEGEELDMYKAEQAYIEKHKPSLNIAKGGFGGDTGGMKGESNHFAILSESDVEQIRIRVHKGEAKQKIADEYFVSRQTIADAASGKTWSHASGPITKPRTAKVLTDDMRKEIHKLRQEDKLSYSKIASKLSISSATAMKYGGSK